MTGKGLLGRPLSPGPITAYGERSRRYRKENPRAGAGYNRKWRYGITPDEYTSRLLGQDGVCAICHQPETYINRAGEIAALCVDHDHGCCPGKRSCGKCIRGLICRWCNSALGLTKDNPDILRAMIVYLEAP